MGGNGICIYRCLCVHVLQMYLMVLGKCAVVVWSWYFELTQNDRWVRCEFVTTKTVRIIFVSYSVTLCSHFNMKTHYNCDQWIDLICLMHTKISLAVEVCGDWNMSEWMTNPQVWILCEVIVGFDCWSYIKVSRWREKGREIRRLRFSSDIVLTVLL